MLFEFFIALIAKNCSRTARNMQSKVMNFSTYGMKLNS